MTSVVEICNMALSHCRAGSINNINEFSLQAQQCRLWFDITRNKVLKETNWGFARVIEPLAVTSETLFNYAYAYRYPSDCLKFERLVWPFEKVTQNSTGYLNYQTNHFVNIPHVPHEIFNMNNVKIIAANYADLRIDYTRKIVDPNLFTDEFVLALSHLLASNIAIPITGTDQGRRIRADSLQLYSSYLNSAVASDSNEKSIPQAESDYITIRG